MNKQYQRHEVLETITDGLRAAGRDVEQLTREDLRPIDEIHIGGRAATEELAALVPDLDNAELLDIGCGVGGPMRTLAAEYRCHATGLDITFEYCRAARHLARLVGIQQAVDIVCAAAPDIPFADESFDVVWTQHTAMNVPDKDLLGREIDRVLRSNGLLVVHEVFAGSGKDVRYPVIWADDSRHSFLESPQQFLDRVLRLQMKTLHWHDMTSSAAEWFSRVIGRFDDKGVPPLSLELVVGESFEQRSRNVACNLAEGSIALYQGVFRKQ